MKLRQISFKLVSLVMVLAILFSVSATTISAAAQSIEHDHTEENTDEKIYVSLGDSMTNGYGLPGYDGNTGVEDYGNGSYANIFADYINADKHYQLAMSAMRSEDLHWLLEVDYNDEAVINVIETLESNKSYYKENIEAFDELWYSVFTNGDFWTWKELVCNYRLDVAAYCIEGKDGGKAFSVHDAYKAYSDVESLQIVAEYYQTGVKTADVISLAMGNGNFGVFGFGRLTGIIGFGPNDAAKYAVENALRECSPELQAEILNLKAELEGIVVDYLAGMDLDEETATALTETLMYIAISYVLNYAGSVEAILQLNPNADIILVGLMNTMGSSEGEDASIGDLLALIFEPLNVYIAGLPTFMQGNQNSTYANAKFYYAEAEYVQCLVDVYETEIKNPESIIRDRFVDSIVGEHGDGMVWSMLGLDPIVIDAVEYYEGLSASEKIDLGMSAYSVIVYLAFEQAILESIKGTSISIDSVLGLGNVSLDAEAIMANKDAILAEMMASNVTKDAEGNYTSDAYFKDAGKYVDNYLTNTLNANLANFGIASYKDVDLATLYGTLEQVVYAGMVSAEDAISLLALYIFKTTVTNTCSAVRYPATAKKKMVAAFVTLGASEEDAKVYVDAMYNQVAEGYTGAYTALASKDALAQALVADEELAPLLSLFGRCVIGNGLGAHPSVAGHEALAEAVITAYDEDYTALDETVKNVIKYAEILAQYVSENYEEIYADVHTELREQGVIDELNNYIDIASKAIADAYDVVYGAEFGERFELTKEYILAELGLMDATLVQIYKLVNYETITPETLVTLNALLANLQDHAENLANLGIELATITNEQLMVAVAELKAQAWAQLEILNAELETAVGEAREAILAEIARIQAQLEADIAELVAFANEIKAVIDNAVNSVVDTVEYTKDFAVNFAYSVYTYIYNQAPETYEQFVDALVDAIAVYSHEAAKLAYNWLINNPEKVIEFFDVYGDDIADIFVKYHEVIFGVLGYVGMTYGEDIFYLVLDNADVILPAIYGWFEIHGDLVWDLIVVYFNAIVEYYNLGLDLDFSSPEGIHASLNKIFSLLGELLSMIADGIYDLADALNLVDELEAALAALDAQIRGQIETVLGQIDAHVAEKIALITAQINKQIEILNAQAEKQLAILYAQLETAVGEAREAILAEIAKIEAELAAQIEALKAQLEALVNAEIENAGDLAVALDKLLQDGTFALGQFIYDAIVAYVNDAIRGEFTPNEETIYVSISSGDDAYAQLVAEALSAVAKSEITAESTVWGDLDYDLLAKADLVTIGYSATELTSFAVAQLFGYVKEFIDNDVRNSGLDYVDSVFAGFHAYIDGLNASLGEYGNVEIDTSDEKEYVYGEINSLVDGLIGAGEISDEHYELMGDYGMVALLAGMFFADATLEELDWAQYVGEDNLHYVDDLRAAIRSELLKQGVMDDYVIEVPVLDYALNYVFGDADYITYEGVTLKRAMLEKHLEGAENYTIAIPVVDSLVFAIESYIYSNVAFNYQYGQLIVDLYETNPDVTIVLLGQYNAFDYEIDVFGEYIDLGGLYSYVAQINSVQPFAYALLSENVAYVDISDAETYYESFLNEGTDDSLLNFVLNFVLDPSITDLSEAGHEYVYEQIMNVLTLNCDHVYDNACDTTCNKCGAIREVADHVYVDGECIHCGAIDPDYVPEEPVIPDAPTHNFHVFDDCYDETCNECSYVRVAIGHVFDDCEDATCYMCDYVREEVPGHLFGNCGEDTCERCGKTRPATTHVYNNACDADCNRCGVTREVPAHVYSGCTDATCNVCGAERQASAHTISNKCTDNICDVCGQNVAVNGHVFGAWTVTVEPTRKTEGKQTRTCTGCGLVETATIDALGGIGGGAIAAIVTGSAAVTGAGGFGIYWFLIQKKTFAQLLAALGKGAVESAAVAAEAGAAAAEAGAVAAEAAAEAGAEAAAEATAEAAEAAAETIAE